MQQNAKNLELGIRLSKIRDVFCHGNNTEFADKIGISQQNASAYCKGRVSIGNRTLDKIVVAFPQVNRAWLFLGEGEMLKSDQFITNNDNSNQSAVVNNGIVAKEVNSNQSSDFNRLLSLLESKDRQIDRLITILETKLDN